MESGIECDFCFFNYKSHAYRPLYSPTIPPLTNELTLRLALGVHSWPLTVPIEYVATFGSIRALGSYLIVSIHSLIGRNCHNREDRERNTQIKEVKEERMRVGMFHNLF